MGKGTIRGLLRPMDHMKNFVRETVIGKEDGKRFWTASEHCSRQ